MNIHYWFKCPLNCLCHKSVCPSAHNESMCTDRPGSPSLASRMSPLDTQTQVTIVDPLASVSHFSATATNHKILCTVSYPQDGALEQLSQNHRTHRTSPQHKPTMVWQSSPTLPADNVESHSATQPFLVTLFSSFSREAISDLLSFHTLL